MNVTLVPLGPVYKTNCYLVDDGSAAAVIDPGYKSDKVDKLLADKQLRLELVLLTHGHFDHIGDVERLRRKYGAALIVGAADEYRLDEPADAHAAQGQDIKCGKLNFAVLETPGHTEGSVCYICADCLFSGDTLFCGGVGRTDMPGGDSELLASSLKKLARLPLDYTVLPGHDEQTTLSREKQYNSWLRGGEA